MAITPAQLPAYLEAIKARVEAAAVPVVNAIAETYDEHLRNVTLIESGAHAPVTRTPAVEGRPPALMTGRLKDSVLATPGVMVGTGMAEASVAPHTVYSATIHWGAVHTGKPWMALWIRYIGYAEVKRSHWLRHTVDIPSFPYMIIAVQETIANGALERAGINAFVLAVWGV